MDLWTYGTLTGAFGQIKSKAVRVRFELTVPLRVHPAFGRDAFDPIKSGAERVGVEPTIPLQVYLISSQARSASLAPLRSGFNCLGSYQFFKGIAALIAFYFQLAAHRFGA